MILSTEKTTTASSGPTLSRTTKNSFPPSLSSAAVLFLLSTLSLTSADRVFLTNAANTTTIYPGCPVDLGYRVQYSDLAMLKWVQVQVLGGSAGEVLVESLDNSTREDWDDTRTKSLAWTVPSDWTPGDYIIRAFGNATYPCGTDPTIPHRRLFCDFALEDRETFHLKPLPVSQACPPPPPPPPSVGASVADNKDSKDMKQKTTTTTTTTITKNTTLLEQGQGTEGLSTSLHIILDRSALHRIQDQTIRQVLSNTASYTFFPSTSSPPSSPSSSSSSSSTLDPTQFHLTLQNGTSLLLSDMIPDPATSTRFLQALQLSNPQHEYTATQLLDRIRKDPTALKFPPATTAEEPNSSNASNGTSSTNLGKGLVQQDQIQDKTKEAIENAASSSLTMTREQSLVMGTAMTMVVAVAAAAGWML